MSDVYVDILALREALDRARKRLDMSWRQLAADLGVSPSTLSRMSDGHRPDVDTFAKLIVWLDEPAEGFIVGGPRPLREEVAELRRRLEALEQRPVFGHDMPATIGKAAV